MKDKERARLIARALLDAQAYLVQIIPGQLRETKPVQDYDSLVKRDKGKGKYEFLDLAVENIKGFANFFRASKHFRLALQESEGFFSDLESLVARNITKRASVQLQNKTAKHLCRLLHTLSLFEDSQHWTIDNGRLRIHAAAIRLLLLDGVTEGFLQGWKDLGGPSRAGIGPHWAAAGKCASISRRPKRASWISTGKYGMQGTRAPRESCVKTGWRGVKEQWT